MSHLAKEAILELIMAQGLEAMLVDTTDYTFDPTHGRIAQVRGRSGIGQKLQNLRIVDDVLYADDMRFPAVKSSVGALVVVMRDGRVLTYNDDIVNSVKSPRGGDVTVPFSQGIIAL
jgi:hypothetical protein